MKKIRIKLWAFDAQLIQNATQRIIKACTSTGGSTSGAIPLPVKKKRFTVLRSPHVHKKSIDSFIQCTYKRIIDIYPPRVPTRTIDALMKLQLPSGIKVCIEA